MRNIGGSDYAAVLDSGPLIALLRPSDDHHDAAARWLEAVGRTGGRIVVPMPVVTESCLFMERRKRPDLELLVLRELVGRPELFRIYSPDAFDLQRMMELMDQYRDWPLGSADASVVATAERLGVPTVATIDHKHFQAIVPRHCPCFVIVP